MEPWTPDFGMGYRRAWVRCYGILLHLWNTECFSKILGVFGVLTMCVEETSNLSCLEYARL